MLSAASPNRKLFQPAGVDLLEDRLHEVVPVVLADPEPLPRLAGVLRRQGVDALVGIGAVLELVRIGHAVAVGVRLVRVGAERGLLLVGEAVAVVVGGRVGGGLGSPVVRVRRRRLPLAADDRVDGAGRAGADLRHQEQHRRDDHGDEQERAHIFGGGLAAFAAQPGEEHRDGREQPGSRGGAGRDDRQLEERAARGDRRREESARLKTRARHAGADGADHHDLAAAPDARQRRLPRARDAADRGGHEHDQRAGADLRHRGRDGSSSSNRPRMSTSSVSSAAATPARVARTTGRTPAARQPACPATVSERVSCGREARDPTWSWAVPGGRQVSAAASVSAVSRAAVAGGSGGSP